MSVGLWPALGGRLRVGLCVECEERAADGLDGRLGGFLGQDGGLACGFSCGLEALGFLGEGLLAGVGDQAVGLFGGVLSDFLGLAFGLLAGLDEELAGAFLGVGHDGLRSFLDLQEFLDDLFHLILRT